MIFDTEGNHLRCVKCGSIEIEAMSAKYAMLLEKRKDGSKICPPVPLALQLAHCRHCDYKELVVDVWEDLIEWRKLPRYEDGQQ